MCSWCVLGVCLVWAAHVERSQSGKKKAERREGYVADWWLGGGWCGWSSRVTVCGRPGGEAPEYNSIIVFAVGPHMFSETSAVKRK